MKAEMYTLKGKLIDEAAPRENATGTAIRYGWTDDGQSITIKTGYCILKLNGSNRVEFLQRMKNPDFNHLVWSGSVKDSGGSINIYKIGNEPKFIAGWEYYPEDQDSGYTRRTFDNLPDAIKWVERNYNFG